MKLFHFILYISFYVFHYIHLSFCNSSHVYVYDQMCLILCIKEHVNSDRYIDYIHYTHIAKVFSSNQQLILQVEMTTRAELAFNILDTDKTGYITLRQLKMISKKLSSNDVKALMIKVFKNNIYEISRVFQLTSSLTLIEMENLVWRSSKCCLTMLKGGEKHQRKLKW
jgi:hypothetical protein